MDGADVTLVRVRVGSGARWALAQPGNDTRVNVQAFSRQDVVQACQARGWRVLELRAAGRYQRLGGPGVAGGAPEVPSRMELPAATVTADNVDDFIDLGF